MAGTSEGAKKAHATIIATRGKRFVRERQSKGGSASKHNGFATSSELAREAAYKSHAARRLRREAANRSS